MNSIDTNDPRQLADLLNVVENEVAINHNGYQAAYDHVCQGGTMGGVLGTPEERQAAEAYLEERLADDREI